MKPVEWPHLWEKGRCKLCGVSQSNPVERRANCAGAPPERTRGKS